MIDLEVDVESDGLLVAKLSSESWEVNIRASAAEFAGLDAIDSASWNARSSIRAGVSAGSAAFWSHDAGEVSILIGEDDEMWDIAVTVPVAIVRRLVAFASAHFPSFE